MSTTPKPETLETPLLKIEDDGLCRPQGEDIVAILSLSVARVKETVTALSVSLGEERKHRPFYLSIGGSPRRASGELSLYRWLSETMKNTIAAAEANRKVDRSRGMRHDPG
ncbi:hypothetical protein F2Q69_00043474 [Brassica cretica]|uniref:Uncharacterized protein n=1 Tax=Brassica cretica TaxID=69181 RepID=A0A8S9NDN7_BRACR|nr:hypothetical protein F2Q69_00043474 [Brassica cretica]